MEKPIVSIMVPTHNDSGTLSRCLRSVLEQDYENLMVAALDNRSSDETYDILIDFERRYRDRLYTGRTFTHLINHEHRGRCMGLVNPRTRFMQYLNATDVISPNYVSRAVELLESNEQIGCVLTHADVIHPSGKIEQVPRYRRSHGTIPGDMQMEFFMAHGFALNTVQLYRIEVYDLSWKENLIFQRIPEWLPLVMASSISNFGYISDALAFRGDPVSIQGDHFIPTIEDLLEQYLFLHAFQAIAARIEQRNVCEQFPKAIQHLSMECLRYCGELMKNGGRPKAKSYFSLALAFFPEIADSESFKVMAKALEDQ